MATMWTSDLCSRSQPSSWSSPSPRTYITAVETCGVNPTNQTFTVRNTGQGTLQWMASEDVPWLTLSPSSGALGTG